MKVLFLYVYPIKNTLFLCLVILINSVHFQTQNIPQMHIFTRNSNETTFVSLKFNFHLSDALDKNTTSIYLHQIYHYIKKESTGIKVYNNLNLSNDTKQFKSELKNYLHAHSFYSVDEYLNVNRE
jgi:hydroxymethylglutaryl-CoA reductase